MTCLNILIFCFSFSNPQSSKTHGFHFRLTILMEKASEDQLHHIVAQVISSFFFLVVCFFDGTKAEHTASMLDWFLLSMVSLSRLFFLKYVVVMLLCSKYV